ncbi:MAG: ATP-binding protein [Nanoarchaeota archaeon]
MAKDFYNRKNELGILKAKHEDLGSGQMLAIYGRRRVGKTELIKEFLSKLPNKEKLYIYIDLSSRQEILNTITASVHDQLGETVRFDNFGEFLAYLKKKAEHSKFVLAIDEFPRLLSIAPEFITKLQNEWDSRLRHEKIMVILVGSSIGMMQKITESKAGALYGRATRLKVSPFRYADFRLMFTELTEEQKIERFAVFGGTPYYLAMTKGIGSTREAIISLTLKKGGDLAEEPKALMEFENVRAHAKYNSILHSIASGRDTLKDIADFTKLKNTVMPAYIKKMDELLDIIGKNDPMLGKERTGKYAIRDNFFRFWYRFIFPNQTSLSLGNEKIAMKAIDDDLNSYTGRIFEDVCRELLTLYLNRKIKGTEISFDSIGAWWDRNTNEVDIVANNKDERKVYAGEVKWTNHPCGIDVLNSLIEKSKMIPLSGTYQFMLISKSGFTDECISKMKQINALHLDLKDIQKLFDSA